MFGFSCAYNQSKHKIVRHLEDVIESRGGTFRGDTKKGKFCFGKRLGRLSGEYHFTDTTINIEILRKPIYFSHQYIERMISAYFRRQLIGADAKSVSKTTTAERSVELV